MDVSTLATDWQQTWQDLGYQDPTAIQEKLFQPLVEKENVLGVSPTGSGKTVAYLLPLLTNVRAGEGNQLLILLPTQELAMQVTDVAKTWLAKSEIKVQPLIGQANIKRQMERLKAKPEILIGTPGRVYELIVQKKIKAHLLHTLVLDEVDHLLEHSELNAARRVIQRLTKEVQVIGISATGTSIEKEFAALVGREFSSIDVGVGQKQQPNVIHGYIRTTLRKRGAVLRGLGFVPKMRAIVFFNEVSELGAISEKLDYDGVSNATLASDQTKFERQAAIQAFQDHKVPFLLTTDLGARGLDFKEVDYVIHYDVPYKADSYLHRSGRTGRMNQSGTVLTLLSDHQMKDLKTVSKESDQSLQELFLHGGSLSFEEPNKELSQSEKAELRKKAKKNKK